MAPNAPGERRPTGTDPRPAKKCALWVVRNLCLNSENGRRGRLSPYKVLSLTTHWSCQGKPETLKKLTWPYRVGLALGALWSAQQATLRLAGNLAHMSAQPLIVSASIADFAPVQLAFAWTQAEDLPLILGQVNFFMVFEVCFFRVKSLFELRKREAG